MKTFFKNIISGLIIGFTAFGIIYASLTSVEPGDTLTAEMWNNLVPVGATITFNSSTCPVGWLPADGTNGTVDLRGVFIRGANSFDNGATYNNRDEDRAISGSGVLTEQGDAIRNITAHMLPISANGSSALKIAGTAGAFYKNPTGDNNQGTLTQTSERADSNIRFDASRVVPTGSDNRPKNIALIYCIKA